MKLCYRKPARGWSVADSLPILLGLDGFPLTAGGLPSVGQRLYNSIVTLTDNRGGTSPLGPPSVSGLTLPRSSEPIKLFARDIIVQLPLKELRVKLGLTAEFGDVYLQNFLTHYRSASITAEATQCYQSLLKTLNFYMTNTQRFIPPTWPNPYRDIQLLQLLHSDLLRLCGSQQTPQPAVPGGQQTPQSPVPETKLPSLVPLTMPLTGGRSSRGGGAFGGATPSSSTSRTPTRSPPLPSGVFGLQVQRANTCWLSAVMTGWMSTAKAQQLNASDAGNHDERPENIFLQTCRECMNSPDGKAQMSDDRFEKMVSNNQSFMNGCFADVVDFLDCIIDPVAVDNADVSKSLTFSACQPNGNQETQRYLNLTFEKSASPSKLHTLIYQRIIQNQRQGPGSYLVSIPDVLIINADGLPAGTELPDDGKVHIPVIEPGNQPGNQVTSYPMRIAALTVFLPKKSHWVTLVSRGATPEWFLYDNQTSTAESITPKQINDRMLTRDMATCDKDTDGQLKLIWLERV